MNYWLVVCFILTQAIPESEVAQPRVDTKAETRAGHRHLEEANLVNQE